MAIRINFAGRDILKPGYYGNPWWDRLMRILRYKRNYSKEQITAFLRFNDTLLRLDIHQPEFWRDKNYGQE